MHWETYLCTGKHICALKNIFVHWKTYLCTRKHICALKNIFVHWETYLCTEKHICALKIYNCALKNMPVMCSDQYLCTEIFICALHIWATVLETLFLAGIARRSQNEVNILQRSQHFIAKSSFHHSVKGKDFNHFITVLIFKNRNKLEYSLSRFDIALKCSYFKHEKE